MNKKAVLEGLLFVSGDEGLTKEKIKSILEIDDADVNGLLSELLTDYSSDDRGVTINKFGDVYKIVTKREHADYYKKIGRPVDFEIENSHEE